MNINNSETKTLEELAAENCCTLFDTSAIFKPLGKGREFSAYRAIKEKTDFTEENVKFLCELRKYITNKNNFLITSSILEEISNTGHYNYMKTIRKDGGGHSRDLLKSSKLIKNDKEQSRELLRLRRLMKKEQQEQRSIINAFTDNNKVILFEGEMKNLYNKTSEKYKNLIKEYGLSNTNFDFLITGITLSMTSNPIIFVSNDYNIFHARNRILKDKDLKEYDARFFTRIDFFKFKSLFYFYYRNPKIEQLSGGS